MRAAAATISARPPRSAAIPTPGQPAVKRTMTAGAVLIDLDERVMHVANGPPCSNEYVAFQV